MIKGIALEVPFVPLTLQLACWFHHKFNELPEATRKLLIEIPILNTQWDSIAPVQRRDAAGQWDYHHDPATEPERQYYWNIWCEIDEVETEVTRLKGLQPLSYEGDHVKRREIRDLEARIERLKKSLDNPLSEVYEALEVTPWLQISSNVQQAAKEAEDSLNIGALASAPNAEQSLPDTNDLRTQVPDGLARVAQPIEVAAPESEEQRSDGTPANCLIHMGDFWQVRFGGKETLLRSSRGLYLLRHLLRHPHKGFSIYDLRTLLDPVDPSLIGSARAQNPEEVDSSEGLNLDGATDLGRITDKKGIAAYETRLKTLKETLEDKKARGDTEGAEKAQDEFDQITLHLLGGTDRDGKSRRMGGDFEKTRIRFGVSISRIKTKFKKNLPELTGHLDRCIQSGAECKYNPELEVNWDFGDS